MSKPVLKSPQMCASCHAQFMDKEMNDFGWVKMQDEYSSWLKSAFSANAQHDFNLDATVTCQHCHFPLIESNDPSTNSDGLVHSHFSLGANTAVPALNNDVEHVKRITKFLKSDKMRIHIDKPERTEAAHNAEYINEKIRSSGEKPSYFYLGETVKIQVLVSNIGVGHNFPGGTIDINEAWIHFRVTDANGAIIYNSGDLNENGEVDQNAYFYKSTPIDNNGQEVWKHDLFRMTGESFKRVIAAGESDTIEYFFAVPAWANTPINISATLKYRKLNQRYTNWVLETEDARLPIVDMSESRLSIPIRIKPPTL